MNNVISANLKLQIALQEQALGVSMFPPPPPPPLFLPSMPPAPVFPSASSMMVNGEWYPPDPGAVPCCVLMSGYRPLESAYCCNTAGATDLEIAAYINNIVAPYET